MPGKKDFVSVMVKGERKHLKKILVLCNLKEAYATFKDKYPETKRGFSKFAELRPKQCVLGGSCGTHSVCVCTTHQNMKLMLIASKIEQLTEGSDLPLKTVKDCVTQIQCNPPTVECCLGECQLCGNEEELRNRLETLYDEDCLDEITFKRWTHTHRSNLEAVGKIVDDILNDIFQALKLYQHHAFVTQKERNRKNML